MTGEKKKTHQTHFQVEEMPWKKGTANEFLDDIQREETWLEKLIKKIRQLISGESS